MADDDCFETVAITYTYAQRMVMLSMFEWHGIAAYAGNAGHAVTDCAMTLALGGIPVRVRSDFADEARALLAEAAERCDADPRPPQPLGYRLTKLLFFVLLLPFGVAPPARVSAAIVSR